MHKLTQRFASLPLRYSGTLRGNIANGSPIGDAMPALIVLGACIELRCGADTREMALKDFYLGYQKKDLAPVAFVVAVEIPAQQPTALLACYKLSMRIDQDISAVCAAFMITLKDDRIATVRLAFGGMAAIPARARVTEAALLNQAWNQATINTAITALEEDFKPLSGMHASDLYRLRGAGNLLQRFYLEHSGTTPLLRTHQKLSSLSFSTDTTP